VSTVAAGRRGEDEAVAFLKRNGYRVVGRNVRLACGELDIVARHGRALVFIEVKSRSSADKGLPEEAVGPRKRERIRRCAELYLAKTRWTGEVRVEILSILFTDPPAIEIIPLDDL